MLIAESDVFWTTLPMTIAAIGVIIPIFVSGILSVLTYIDTRANKRAIAEVKKDLGETKQEVVKTKQEVADTKAAAIDIQAVAVDTNANVLKIEKATNSMKDALVAATAKSSHAEGKLEGAAEEKAKGSDSHVR